MKSTTYDEVMYERVALRQKTKRTAADNRRLAALEAELDKMDSARSMSAGERLLQELKEALNGAQETTIKALRAELATVTAQRDELLDVLEKLTEEYEDRRSQFGTEVLWQKHEVPGMLEIANAAILKAKVAL